MNSVIDEKDISTVLEEPRLVLLSDSKKKTKEPSSKTFVGSVVSMIGDKLVMKSKAGTDYTHTLATDAKVKDGKEHAHSVTSDTKVTCDGKVCKTSDLKAGMKIRVTTKKTDAGAAIGIEAIDKDSGFAQRS